MKRQLAPLDEPTSPLLPLAAIGFAIAIFLVDTYTPLGIAVAVLYVIVVLMAGRFFQREGVILVGLACIALTALSYVIQHGETYGAPFIRCLVSLVAIAITTFLALRIQAAGTVLREQARLLDLSHDTIFVRDMNDVITFWNRGGEELYGWSRAEATGKVSHELLHTVFPAPLADIKAELLRSGRWEGELTHTDREGAPILVASRWSLQRDKSGRPFATLETNNDITERKATEVALRRSEAYLAEAQLLSQTGSFAWDMTSGKIAWSDEAYRIFEHDPGLEPTIDFVLERTHPEDRDSLQQFLSGLTREQKTWTVEHRLLLPSGTVKHLNVVAHATSDAPDKFEYVGALMDVTSRKRSEDALRKSEANLADAQRVSKTGSFAWQISTGDVRWSQEAYRIFGQAPNVKPNLDLVIGSTHPDDRAAFVAALSRVAQERPRNWEADHRIVMADGSIKDIHVVAHADETCPVGYEYVGAFVDVTETKQAQEALHRAQAELAHVTRVTTLGELTASIAHEVNQPLAAVVTNGDACLRWLGASPPNLDEARSAVERIVRDGKRASEVIKRLRGLTSKTEPQMLPLDINDVIGEVVTLVQRELALHHVGLRLELTSPPVRVVGDRVQLQQVIINLVMNGVEAMTRITPQSRELRIGSRSEEENHILVAVADHGTGIDPEHVDRIFDPFFTTKRDGMGMGLSICRSIIEAHGGRLWALPNEPRGTRFQFTVPINHEDAS